MVQRNIFFFTIALLLFILNFTGILNFNSWPQIEEVHSSNLDLIDLRDHPHFYRYLISIPGLLARDYISEFGFSLYISLFMICSVAIIYRKLQGSSKLIVVLSCLAIFAAHLFMNGRGAISWLGWMIILAFISNDIIKIGFGKLIIIIFALLCTSVSSGTFTVAFFVVVTVLLREAFQKRSLAIFSYLTIIYFIYRDLTIEGFNRNLSYYSLGTGNPIINMLDHGIGVFFRQNLIQFSILISIIFVFLTFIIFSLKTRLKFWEAICVLYPLAGGIFGYTTLTLIIPSLILVLSSRFGFSMNSKSSGYRFALQHKVR